MSTMNEIRLSRTLGALLAHHAGDALGATHEFQSHASISHLPPSSLREITGGGVFGWPAGHATDDTDMTRAVLLAYRDQQRAIKSGQEEADVVKLSADHFIDWLNGHWPDRTVGSGPEDIGGATSTGLTNYAQTGDYTSSGAGPDSAGNGSLMRCLPTALFQLDQEKLIEESIKISAVTHNDPRCTASCAAYNTLISALLNNRTPVEAVIAAEETAVSLHSDATLLAIRRGCGLLLFKLGDDGPEKRSQYSGYVLDSLSLAVAAVLDGRKMVDILVDVVKIGNDTDTNAAIVGGVLGARDGVEAVPESWRELLQFGDEFESITKELLASFV